MREIALDFQWGGKRIVIHYAQAQMIAAVCVCVVSIGISTGFCVSFVCDFHTDSIFALGLLLLSLDS